jgi:asparagine synthase (glutamine-hydrolysing)
VRDPTADVRVLEFCFGTPEEQFADAGRDRWLMRRALAGMVPEEVAWNRRRGLQGADIAWQMRTDEVAVSASVDLLLRSGFVRNYIDVEAIARRWQKARSGGSQEVGDLASTIHVGVFLLRFME